MIILVGNGDVDGGELRQFQMILHPGAQDPLPMHDVSGAIDRPVGVDIRGPAATLPSAQGITAGSDHGHIVARAGHHPEVVRLRLGYGKLHRSQSVGIGGAGGLLLLTEARAHFHSRDAGAGDAVNTIGQHAAAAGSRDHGHAAHHQQGVGLVVSVRSFDQVEAGRERVDGQFLRIGDVSRRQFLGPTRHQLAVVEQGDLSELGYADDTAAASQIGLVGAQKIAVLHGELAAEEAADQEPEMMLPVVEFFQPGSFVDLFLGAKGGSVVEAMQVGEAGQKFGGVLHVVNAEFQMHRHSARTDGWWVSRRARSCGWC